MNSATSTALDYLARSSFFGPLQEMDRRAVLARMRPVDFDAGQLIFSRGDPGTDVYLVLSGSVRLSVLTVDGREFSLALAAEGSVFGEIAALDGRERTADATAITPVKTLLLPKAALAALIQENPRVSSAAINFLCARLRETDLKLEVVALQSVEVRLAWFLLASLERQSADATTGKVSLNLGISQTEIGLLIGATRPKVNGALVQLESRRTISRTSAGLVCDIDALRRIVDHET